MPFNAICTCLTDGHPSDACYAFANVNAWMGIWVCSWLPRHPSYFTCLMHTYMISLTLHAIVFCHLEIVLGVEGRGRRWNWVEICQTWWCSPTLLPRRSVWMKVKHLVLTAHTHRRTNKRISIFPLKTFTSCLTHVSLQVLQVMFCHSVKPEPSLWSITELKTSWCSTRGSCHGFTPQPIALTRPISTPSSTGMWAVSWVSSLSVTQSFWLVWSLSFNENIRCPPLSDIQYHYLTLYNKCIHLNIFHHILHVCISHSVVCYFPDLVIFAGPNGYECELSCAALHVCDCDCVWVYLLSYS